MNDINSVLSQIIALHDSGGNPQQVMGMFTQNNGNINQIKSQMQNMAQGRSPAEFIIQIARQNGANEQNLQGLARILGVK
jgi:hypothetical protein